jgi:hypothetical protein
MNSVKKNEKVSEKMKNEEKIHFENQKTVYSYVLQGPIT